MPNVVDPPTVFSRKLNQSISREKTWVPSEMGRPKLYGRVNDNWELLAHCPRCTETPNVSPRPMKLLVWNETWPNTPSNWEYPAPNVNWFRLVSVRSNVRFTSFSTDSTFSMLTPSSSRGSKKPS